MKKILIIFYFNFYFNYKKIYIEKKNIMGIGDWGLGIGPNPQSPIPNPHLSKLLFNKIIIIIREKLLSLLVIIFFQKKQVIIIKIKRKNILKYNGKYKKLYYI